MWIALMHAQSLSHETQLMNERDDEIVIDAYLAAILFVCVCVYIYIYRVVYNSNGGKHYTR